MKRILLFLCAAWLHLGCTRSDPSLVPLGRGPLSLAQLREEANPDASTGEPFLRQPVRSRRPKPAEPQVLSPGPNTVHMDRLDAGSRAALGNEATPLTSTAAPNQDAGLVSLDDWLGLYVGDDTTIFKSEDQSERRFDDPKAKIRVERGAKGKLDLVLVDSSNDVDMCKLSASIDGDSATLDPGQTCFLDPEEEMTAKSRPGKATRKARRLTVELILDTLVVIEDTHVEGTIEYHFDGAKK